MLLYDFLDTYLSVSAKHEMNQINVEHFDKIPTVTLTITFYG